MENKVISKELLSEVLGQNVLSYEVKGNYLTTTDFEWNSINIHELAHKCKEWALTKYFMLISYQYEEYYIIHVIKKHGDGYLFKGITDTEPEAIFKACQWIKDNK